MEVGDFQRAASLPRDVTRDGTADLSGGRLPHLQRRLLAVPGGVGGADQVRGVFQRTLRKAASRNSTTARQGEKNYFLSFEEPV